jgi:hypothetical protein
MGSVSGTHELMAKWLYGTGLRLMECRRLRVTDLDGAPQPIVVRDGNGMAIASPCGLKAWSAHSRNMERVSNASMRTMSPKGMAPSCDRSPWHEQTPVPAAFGCGQTCFPPTSGRKPPGQESSAGITPMHVDCNGP